MKHLRYSTCADPQFARAGDWGMFTSYLDVADDQCAARQVQVFVNGSRLCYDHEHWCDIFGSIEGLHFGGVPRRLAQILPDCVATTAAEFEEQWRLAKRGELWQVQPADPRGTETGNCVTWHRR